MNLYEGVRQYRITALKEHLVAETAIYTYIISQANAVAKSDGNRQPTDQDVLKVVKKILKENTELLIVLGNNSKNANAKEKLLIENTLLQKLLPKQMTREEIRDRIKVLANELMGYNDKHPNKGSLMKSFKAYLVETSSDANMKLVNDVIDEVYNI